MPNIPQSPKAVLHLGAHKTASTHFFRSFRRNNQALRKFGWRIPKKAEIRDNTIRAVRKKYILVRLLRKKTDADRHAVFGDQEKGVHTLFLSDENILGRTTGVLRFGQFYPKAEKRLKKVIKYLDGYDVSLIMLATRNPATFLPSVYCETVRQQGYIPLEDYMGAGTVDMISWSALVERLLTVRQAGRNLIIWRYEDYFDRMQTIQRRMLGLGDKADLPDLAIKEKPVRLGMSGRALEEIKNLGSRFTRDAAEDIMKRYPKSADYPAPNLLDSATVARLTVAYEADIARLRAMERVEFL